MASEKWRKITIYAIIGVSLLLILIGMLMGIKSVAGFIRFMLLWFLIVLLFGGVAYIVFILFFKKEYKDIPAQFKKKLFAVTKIMKDDMLGELFLSGDGKHNRVHLGKYFYLRLNLPKLVVDTPDKDKLSVDSKSESVPVDCFIVKRRGFFDKLFLDPIFILVRPEDHDYSSIFNDVTINGFNLVPLDSQFFTIDKRNLDLDMVRGLELNYIRETVFEVLKDLDRLVKQAMNLDHVFQKEKEKAREFEIPQFSGVLGGGNK